jgi:hypothetical protein
VQLKEDEGGNGKWSAVQVLRVMERLDPFREEAAAAA